MPTVLRKDFLSRQRPMSTDLARGVPVLCEFSFCKKKKGLFFDWFQSLTHSPLLSLSLSLSLSPPLSLSLSLSRSPPRSSSRSSSLSSAPFSSRSLSLITQRVTPGYKHFIGQSSRAQLSVTGISHPRQWRVSFSRVRIWSWLWWCSRSWLMTAARCLWSNVRRRWNECAWNSLVTSWRWDWIQYCTHPSSSYFLFSSIFVLFLLYILTQ